MADSAQDDYQQRIDPALRSFHFPSPRIPPTPTEKPSSSSMQDPWPSRGLRINSNNNSNNKTTYHPHTVAHELQYSLHPSRSNLETNLDQSTLSTSSFPSSSSASSHGCHSPNFLCTNLSTGSIPELLRAHRGPTPTQTTSLQDLPSSLKSPHPFSNGYFQCLDQNSPGSFSTGRQTTTTTTSQDSGVGKPTSSRNRKEFDEQQLHNQNYQPSEEDAKPNDKISAELDYSLRRLINLDVFRQVLEDPNSRHAFRQAIIQGLSSSSTPSTSSLIKLDLWADCRGLNQMLHLLKIGTCALSEVYLNPAHSPTAFDDILAEPHIGGEVQSRLLRSIKRLEVLADEEENDARITHYDDNEEGDVELGGLKAIENRLLISLYQKEFPLFLKKTLVSNVTVKLGKFNLEENDRNGIGDCFCLTNPRMRDHPIVLVSDGFTKVTGYERHAIVGKNCRFLQGPGTSPESVQRIRDGLNTGEGCTELLLNYRKDGAPFYCLLCIIPLRDVTGALMYFIGGQINVTGMLSSKKGLSFLMTNDAAQTRGENGQPLSRSMGGSRGTSTDDLLGHVGLNQHSFSPAMQQHVLQGQSSSGGLRDTTQRYEDRGIPTEHHAAGSIITDGKLDSDFGQDDAGHRTGPLRFLRRLASNHHPEPHLKLSSPYQSPPLSTCKNSNQKLVGAETLFHQPKPLSDHFKQFEFTYSHLMVFQRETRRVIFTTTEVIELFGLPHSNSKEIYKSKLIQTDFSELVWSMTPTIKESVANLRAHLRKTIKAGISISLDCQVKTIDKGFFFSRNKDVNLFKLRPTKIHLTPLQDRDGRADAYVCVFG